jgi:homoserine O-acetyltransferase
MQKIEIFELGNFPTQRGTVLPNARLAYATMGELNAKKDNVVVCPTWFTGYINDVPPIFVGEGRAIDPNKHFVVIPGLFSMGESSSPSNTPPPHEYARFPHVTYYDNVLAQHRLLTEKFGIEQIALVSSWSMGGTQSFQWAAQYPDMVKAIAPVACSARTSIYNELFLKSNIKAIMADTAYDRGYYGDEPPLEGMRVMAYIYAGWGMSEEFYRVEGFKLFGHPTLDDFLVDFWEAYFGARDANNLINQMWTWINGDISDQPAYDGDFKKALGAIKAKAVVMPSATDQYFPPVDNEAEVAAMPNATLNILPSILGHFAPFSPDTQKDIDDGIREAMSAV